MRVHEDIGVAIPEVLLPRPGTDLEKWAVIACDQFTSEPDYWERVLQHVGDAPSTLRLVFPEIYLDQPSKEERIRGIQATMQKYLSDGLLRTREGAVYVERRIGGKKRKGLLLCLDLERYDYNKGAGSLIRATEGTIVSRLPPRMAVREGAALELPHVLVLIDDPDRTVIEPLEAGRENLELLYDFELMFESGHLTGFALSRPAEDRAIAALRELANPFAFRARHRLPESAPVLLFAMGDGNHSLAAAKAVWEGIKSHAPKNHPARYALVEIENVHDEALQFEPIHRVLFHVTQDLLRALGAAFGDDIRVTELGTAHEMMSRVDGGQGSTQLVGLLQPGGQKAAVIEFLKPTSTLAVGTVQDFLDAYLPTAGGASVDYVHGADSLIHLAQQPTNAGFYLPPMDKSALFRTVIADGALPRKTFSMGEAREKRFYMEARKIA